MIRKNQQILNFINVFTDILAVAMSYYISVWYWLVLKENNIVNPAVELLKGSNGLIAIAYGILTVSIYYTFKFYDTMRVKKISSDIKAIFKANLVAILGITFFLFTLKIHEFSRGVIVTLYFTSTAMILLKRVFIRLILIYYRKKGYNLKHTLIIGNGRIASQYVEAVKNNPQCGFVIVGYVSRTQRPHLGECLGTYEDLPSILSHKNIDEAVIALEVHETERISAIISECRKQGCKISIIPFYNEFISENPMIDVIGDVKLINVQTSPLENIANAACKRMMDIIGSLIFIIIFSPVMLVAAIGTKLTNNGSVIFKQARVGLNKKVFTMMKFRSMRVNDSEDSAWSTNEDNRKTKFGSFLRKTSMDELPQFFNVLNGTMSLVGPRPEIPHYVEQFKEEIPLYMLKHQVKPGITGWAQVNGFRGDTSIEGRIKCDIWYIEHWTPWLDIRILFRTAFGGMLNKEKL